MPRLPEQFPYLPFYYYPHLESGAGHHSFSNQIFDWIKGGALIFESAGQLFGLLNFKEWETRHFGLACGMIDFLWAHDKEKYTPHIKEILAKAKEQGIQHLSIRIDAQEHDLLLALEKAGFLQMDAIVHFNGRARDLKLQPLKGNSDFKCREAQSVDSESLCALAAKAYTDDRFHSDPAIANKDADTAYADWMKNALNGLADKVYLFTDDEGQPGGFITLNFESVYNTRVAKIWLVGVAAEYQGTGASYALLNHVITDLQKIGIDYLEVGTQLRNVRAMRFYAKYGLLPVNPVYAYRKIID